MKNISKPLATGYYNLLDGMVVEKKKVSVNYLKAPYPTQAPYIVIGGIHTHNTNTRDSFCGEATVDLNIYTEFEGDYGSFDLADAIASEVLGRVIPEPGATNVEAEDFNIAGAKMIGMTDFEDTRDDKSIYGKRITIEHLIYQLQEF